MVDILVETPEEREEFLAIEARNSAFGSLDSTPPAQSQRPPPQTDCVDWSGALVPRRWLIAS